MPSFRIAAVAILGLLVLAAAPPVRAQDNPGYSLRAAFGGAVPYARKDSYVVATLAGASKDRKLALSSSLPLASLSRPIFDSRPQYVLGGNLALGHVGGGVLSLDGQIAAGAEKVPDEPRPLLGLARLRLVF